MAHFVIVGSFIGLMVAGVYFYDLYDLGWHWGESLDKHNPIKLHASTLAFATLVIMQLVNAFNARSLHISVFKLETNFYLWGAVASSALLVGMIVYLPWFQDKMHTVALSHKEWLLVILTSFSVLAFEEIRKLILRRRKR